MPLESRKLIFPNANLGDDLDDLGCKQIHDVSGTDFRRSEVEAHSTAVSKVAVAITTRHGDNGSAQATKGIYVLNGWQRTAEEMKGRLPITGRSWEAILQPCSGLQRKRMKRRRQIGGGEEYSGSAKDNADEALSVGILLWRIRASKALKDLASREEFAEVEACEGTALIGPDNVWFESTEETKQGGELGNEGLEAAGRSGGVELGTVRWPNASKTGSGVDSDTVRYVAIREAGDEWASTIHVDNSARGRLFAIRILMKR